MLLTVKMVQSDGDLYRRSQYMKFFCNDIEYKDVTAIDTERGYIDYFKRYNGELILTGDNILIHRIFGECRIEETQ